MKIAANLGVLDEVELIGPCIAHLRHIGVDAIVATDLGSTDGTRERLRSLQAEDLQILPWKTGADPWGFAEQMFQETVSRVGADWILSIDADEFWLPLDGRLKNTAALASADVISVRRFNVPMVDGANPMDGGFSADAYPELPLIVRPVERPAMWDEVGPELPWIVTRVLPKAMVRASAVTGFSAGGHGGIARGAAPLRTVTPDDLVIAHVPFSTLDRFQRKAANLAHSVGNFGHHLVGKQAWHWRRWSSLRGPEAASEFAGQAMSADRFAAAKRDGTIQTAQEWFRERS